MAQPSASSEPVHVRKAGLPAFFELAFRPLYLAGAAWAAVAIGIWIFAPQWLTAPLGGVAWHAHEMLWGFVATIAVAFLMTAGATWTGINPLHGTTLAAACLLWLIARIGFLIASDVAFAIAAFAELAFFLLAAIAMMRAVHAARNARNYAVPWLVVGLAGADVFYLAAVRDGDFTSLMRRFDIGLTVMAMIALLIARRVIPFFAMRAVPGLKLPMQMRAGQAQLVMCAVAVIGLVTGVDQLVAAGLLLAGGLALWQVVRWRPLAVRAYPLLWILYTGYTGLALGLLLAGGGAAGLLLPPAIPVHVIALAGFSVLIIGMITRTALGHLGLPLQAGAYLRLVYALMLAAVVLRLAAFATPSSAQTLLHLSACAWIVTFA
ncbi:MAG: NnrS family protein, partial [Casimicrobiaceae bacterium]